MADDGEDASGSSAELAATIDGLQARTDKLALSAKAFSGAMTSAFLSAARGGKSFDDVLKSLALRLSNLALAAALKPITQALTNGLTGGINNLFGSLLSTGGSSAGGGPVAFASGGVIATPNYFALGNRPGVGLAGEAGPEAILPLARGPDGQLGVAAGGGGNITINIATPDADSFRRSETYLTGLVARAVARGQRGM